MLKNKIQEEFIKAFKAKDEPTKRALSSFKAKIQEAEKGQKNQPLDDLQITQLLSKLIIQRQQSLLIYIDQKREDLAKVEQEEIDVLEKFLPPKMTKEEIVKQFFLITASIPSTLPDVARIGKAIGVFNKQFPGQSTPEELKALVTELQWFK